MIPLLSARIKILNYTTLFFLLLIFLFGSFNLFGAKNLKKNSSLVIDNSRLELIQMDAENYAQVYGAGSQLVFLDSLEKVAIKKRQKIIYRYILYCKATYYANSNKKDSGIAIFEKLNTFKSDESLEEYMGNNCQLLSLYLSINRTDKALSAFKLLMDTLDKANSKELTAKSLNFVGLALYSNKYYNEALGLFKRAYLKNCYNKKRYKAFWLQQEIIDNIGLCYSKLNNYKKALSYYNTALNFITDSATYYLPKDDTGFVTQVVDKRIPEALINISNNIVLAYVELKLYNKAINVIKEILEVQGPDSYDPCMYNTAKFNLLLCNVMKKDKLTSINLYGSQMAGIIKCYDPTNYNSNNIYYLKSQYFNLINNPDSSSKYVELMNNESKKWIQSYSKNNFLKNYLDLKFDNQTKNLNYLQELNKKKSLINAIYLGLLIIAILFIMLFFNVYNKLRIRNRNFDALNKDLTFSNQRMMEINRRLEDAAKDKEDLFHILAHDLRAPVANILSINELSRQSGQDESAEERQFFMDMIDRSCQQSFDIINSLLDAAETDKIKLSTKVKTDFHQLLRDMMELNQFQLSQKNINIEWNLSAESHQLKVDALAIQRAVNNLIVNAIKFNNDGGTIKISTYSDDFHFYLYIKDSGIGIPENLKPILFDKFTNAGRSGTKGEKSTGLGLAITKRILDLHNATIKVDSIEGKGTTFQMVFLLID